MLYYNSMYKCDVIAHSETMLYDTVHVEDICSEGFGKEVFRNDHPGNAKVNGICMHFREDLSF